MQTGADFTCFVYVHLKFTRICVYPVRSVLIRVLFFALSV